jgi:selenocysteine lyase/cysteine desulfurase
VAFDVARVRGLVPALGDGWLHFDAIPGIQVSEHVVQAVSTAMRAPVSGPGGGFPAAQRAEVIEEAARAAVADLVGADPALNQAAWETLRGVVGLLPATGTDDDRPVRAGYFEF